MDALAAGARGRSAPAHGGGAGGGANGDSRGKGGTRDGSGGVAGRVEAPMAVTVPAGGGGVASKRLREQSGQLELAKGRTADERARAEAIAEASFSVYYKPTELYLELQQRLSWKGNGVPVFMRRNLLFRRVAPRPPRPTSPKVRVTVRSTIKAPVTLLIMLARKVSTGGSTVYDVAQTLAAPVGKAHDGGDGAAFSEPCTVEVDTLRLASKDGARLIIAVLHDRPQLSWALPRAAAKAVERPLRRVDIGAITGAKSMMWCDRLDLEKHMRSAGTGDHANAGVHTVSGISKWDARLKPMRIMVQNRNGGGVSLVFAKGENLPGDVSRLQAMQVTVETADARLSRGQALLPHSSARHDEGAVLFHYLYFNNTRRKVERCTQWSCPWCMLKCGTYDGLQCHLLASHDLFGYDFGPRTSDGSDVNIKVICRTDAHDKLGSLRILDSEMLAEPSERTFWYRRGHGSKSLHKQLDSERRSLLVAWQENEVAAIEAARARVQAGDKDKVKDATDKDVGVRARKKQRGEGGGTSGAGKKRDKAAEVNARPGTGRRTGPTPLDQRQFYHSRTCQPMSLEEVYGEEDSDDEIDITVADAEDLAMLGEYANLDDAQLEFMHLWNMFTMRHQIFADTYVPKACGIFAGESREQLSKPAMRRCFVLHLLNLTEFGLLDGQAMTECLRVVDGKASTEPADAGAVAGSPFVTAAQ